MPLAIKWLVQQYLQVIKIAVFTNLKKMIPVKAKETGEAQQATSTRDDAWEVFDEWFLKFKKCAILALGDQPQLRGKMGWKELSGKLKRDA